MDKAWQDKTADKNNDGCKTKLKLYVKQDYSANTKHEINIKILNNLQGMELSTTISLPDNIADMWIKNCTKNAGCYNY